jgi:hypothetical protein
MPGEGLQNKIEEEVGKVNIEEGLSPEEQVKKSEEALQDKPAEKPAEEPAKPEEKKETPAEDPDVEIGGVKVKKSVLEALELDLEGGKKIKLADLKKGFMLQEDYTKKTQEIKEKEAEIKELVDWANGVKKNPKLLKLVVGITEKAFGEKDYNNEFIDKALTILEDKKEEVQEKIEDIEKLLANIDPESPQYAALKQALLNGQALEKKLGDIQKKMSEKETLESEAKTADEKAKFADAVKQAQTALTNCLAELSDAAKPEGLKFTNDDEKGLWRQLVIATLQNTPKQYKDEAEFLGTVKETGKTLYGVFTKLKEAIIAAHLESKKFPPAGPAKPEEKKPEEKKEETPAPSGGLQGKIEEALKEQMKLEEEQNKT